VVARPRHSSKQIDALLEELAREPERWRFGYELSRELAIGSGTLYPALIRLADAGLLEQRWEQPNGQRPRHMYRLSCDGVLAERERNAHAGVNTIRPRPAAGGLA